jgi:Tol biopolymer transport system component
MTTSTETLSPTANPRRARTARRGLALTCGGVLLCLAAGLLGALGAGYWAQTSGVFSGTPGNWDGLPAWSPDGQQIAFVSNRDGNSDIFVMAADGANVRQLTRDPLADLYLLQSPSDADPAWSPDGARIVFTSGRQNGMMSYLNFDLFVMNADGSEPELLLYTDSPDYGPTWSPDGRAIAANRGGDIYRTDLATRQQTLIYSEEPLLNASGADWSPDGRHLAFSGNAGVRLAIFVAEADGSNPRQLTDGPLNDRSPRWSPDGLHIVFSSDRDGDWELYSMDADGDNLTQLTNNTVNDEYPDWSPDGSQIAYVSDRDGDSDIYVMEADGGHIVQITGDRD